MPNFFISLISDFYMQMLVAAFMFIKILPYNKNLKWKIPLASVLFIGISYGLICLVTYVNSLNPVVNLYWFYFPVIFIILCGFILSLGVPFKTAVGICLICYCVQNIGSNLSTIINQYAFENERTTPINLLISIIIFAVVYGIIYFVFIRKLRNTHDVYFNTVGIILLSTVVIVIIYLLNVLTFGKTDSLMIYLRILFIACPLLTLFIQFGIFDKNKLVIENQAITKIMENEQKHYAFTKTTIDTLNMRCHDIKHQIFAIQKGNLSSSELDSVKKSIETYESIAKTKNSALNLILTEKGLYCLEHGIQFVYNVDDAMPDIFKATDLYSLLGNALDNAIESVEKEQDNQKRLIEVQILVKNDFLFVNIENYTVDENEINDELPKTSKANTLFHGYGLRSIKYITEKYGGEMKVQSKNHFFKLSLLFPINTEEQ